MSLQHHYAVHRDGYVETCFEFPAGVRPILERIARCAYMVDMHRQGVALNSTRIEELRVELEHLREQR